MERLEVETCIVLIVDDDDDVRGLIAQFLTDEGYRTIEAANGRDALERLEKGPLPSLILLDLTMPVMDGFEFRTEQLRHATWASIPVVVFSARGATERGLTANASIEKPLSLERLLSVVQRFCQGEPG